MTAEHLIARSIGGIGDINNLAPACYYCNNKRGNTDLVTFIAGQINASIIKAKIQYAQALIGNHNDKLLNLLRNNIVTEKPTSHYRFWHAVGYRA